MYVRVYTLTIITNRHLASHLANEITCRSKSSANPSLDTPFSLHAPPVHEAQFPPSRAFFLVVVVSNGFF